MSPTLRAAIWMGGAITSFSAMAIAGRAVSLDHDTFEIMLFRSLVGFVIVVTVAWAAGTLNQVGRGRLGLHALRNTFHFAGQNFWFYGLTMIPLAQLFALEFTTPLWVLVLSPLVLGERLTRVRALAALVGFAGILIVARPSPDTINSGVIAGLMAAVAFAGALMTTKLLTRTESTTCILFYLTTMQGVLGLAFAGYDGDIGLPTPATLPWLTLIACSGLMAHFCITKALALAPASVVIPFDFVRLPAIAVIGIMFYNEPFDIFVFAGAAVIFAGIYINILGEQRARRADSGSLPMGPHR